MGSVCCLQVGKYYGDRDTDDVGVKRMLDGSVGYRYPGYEATLSGLYRTNVSNKRYDRKRIVSPVNTVARDYVTKAYQY